MATDPHPALWHRRRPPRLAPPQCHQFPHRPRWFSSPLIPRRPIETCGRGPARALTGPPAPPPTVHRLCFDQKNVHQSSMPPATAAGRPRATGRGRPDSRRVLRGFRALTYREIRSGCQKRTRRRSAFFAGCGILFPLGFQPSKDGDMVCARGPLGAYLRQMTDRSEVGS